MMGKWERGELQGFGRFIVDDMEQVIDVENKNATWIHGT
jgi:hypothetical protein